MKKFEIIVIGASAGGVKLLPGMLKLFSSHFPLPLVIVQHMAPENNDSYNRYLDGICPLKVKEADEKEGILPGTIYLAAPNYHLFIEMDRTFSLSIDARVNYSRPSIDVLFESAVYAYGASIIAVILTGANSDGSHGAKTIKECGGIIIVQNPQTAEAPTMPQSVIEACHVDYILEPLAIPGKILELLEIY